jgi:ribosomal protein L11 methyltransferase
VRKNKRSANIPALTRLHGNGCNLLAWFVFFALMTLAWSAKIVVPAAALPAFEPVFTNLTDVVSLFEVSESAEGVSLTWAVEGLFAGPPPQAEIAARVALAAQAAGMAEPALEIGPVAAKDWLTETVTSFPPLSAGRFYIHGDHVPPPYPAGKLRLRINAATAFGSGEHASTYGCLQALDGLARRKGVARAVGARGTLDMGCGSGILALAMAKAWRRPVLAADIDPEAVRVTRANAAANGVGSEITAILSDGTGDRHIRRSAPYAVITANILARPLRAMSQALTALLAPGGSLILAGLLQRQEAMVLTAYRAQGLRLERRIVRRPWSILVLRKA